MKNFSRLFVLCQELTNVQTKQKGRMASTENKKKWLDLERLIALHSKPAIINDSWTLPVWSGIAVARGLDHTQIDME